MTVLAHLALGLVVGAGVYLALRPTLASPLLSRTNHRGAPVATAAGLVVVLALVLVDAGFEVADAAGHHLAVPVIVGRRVVVLAAVGFGLLGFVDDLLGVGDSGGFRGHLRAMAKGRLTSGGVKLVGGGAVALISVAAVEPSSMGRLLVDGALVALSANLANLLDRAPGRCLKVTAVAFAVLAATAAADPILAGVALAVGAGLALVRADLGESVMLGDAGANVLGAALGLGVVLTAAPSTRSVVLVVLVALNLISEKVSFSRVIERVGPLRAIDRLGRRPPQG